MKKSLSRIMLQVFLVIIAILSLLIYLGISILFPLVTSYGFQHPDSNDIVSRIYKENNFPRELTQLDDNLFTIKSNDYDQLRVLLSVRNESKEPNVKIKSIKVFGDNFEKNVLPLDNFTEDNQDEFFYQYVYIMKEDSPFVIIPKYVKEKDLEYHIEVIDLDTNEEATLIFKMKRVKYQDRMYPT